MHAASATWTNTRLVRSARVRISAHLDVVVLRDQPHDSEVLRARAVTHQLEREHLPVERPPVGSGRRALARTVAWLSWWSTNRNVASTSRLRLSPFASFQASSH